MAAAPNNPQNPHIDDRFDSWMFRSFADLCRGLARDHSCPSDLAAFRRELAARLMDDGAYEQWATHIGEQPPSIPESYVYDPQGLEPADEQIFQGLLSRDELAVWIGHEKHRKTTLVLNFAICAALGKDFLGFRFVASAPLQVVMFDYESKGNSIRRRLNHICDALALTPVDRDQLAKNLEIIKLRKMIHDGLKIPKIDASGGAAWWEHAVADHPAELYIVDPFRCLHGAAESDSKIEETLRLIRSVFRRATVVPHHMVKESRNPKDNIHLRDNFRLWSEACRGSGAIKGHVDVILGQERLVEDDVEVVWFGGYMKDGGDIDPMPLVESALESFLYEPHTDLPDHLRKSFHILQTSGSTSWANRTAVVETLVGQGVKEKTAYRHVKQLIQRGVLREARGGITFAEDAGRYSGSAGSGYRHDARSAPPENRFDPYAVLGISRQATKEEIRTAYRTAMAKYHPDKVAHVGVEWEEIAHQKALDLNRAYEMLDGVGEAA